MSERVRKIPGGYREGSRIETSTFPVRVEETEDGPEQ